MPAETRLGTLGVFKFDDLDTLDGLFAHSEQTGSDLSNYMIVIRLEILRITAFACAGKGIPDSSVMGFGNHRWQANRAEGHTAAIYRGRNDDVRAPVISAVERDFRGYLRFIHLFRVRRKFKAQFIEAASGIADVILNIRALRHMTGFSHYPGSSNHIRSPAEVAKSLVHGIQ